MKLYERSPLPLRAAATSAALAACVAGVIAAGWKRLDPGAGISLTEVHRPAERVALLEQIATAIVPEEEASAVPAACPELANVKKAVDARLAGLAERSTAHPAVVTRRYILDMQRWEPLDPAACAKRAQEVDQEVTRSIALLRAPESWRENSPNKSEALWRGRFWRPHLRDIDTRNGWAILPGCVRDPDGTPVGGVCEERPAGGLNRLIADPQVAEGLAYRVSDLARSPSGREAEFRGKRTLLGHDVVLGLESDAQTRASASTRCFTGDTTLCSGILPPHLETNRHFLPGSIRAGAAAVVVVEVHTGLVVAAAGAVSECTRTNLARKADQVRDGVRTRTPLFRPGGDELCAQVPDRYGAQGLLTLSPVFWLVGPGSSCKPTAILAGIENGVISPAMDSIYRVMLAQSHDPDGRSQLVPQRIARQSKERFSALLEHFGFVGYQPQDVLLGTAGGALGWRLPIRSGFSAEPFDIDEPTFQQIAAAKRAGLNADRIFGHKMVAEYLKGTRLSIAAIGAGDIRHSAWGLADYARRLALRAEGAESMAPTRLASLRDAKLAPVPLDFARPDSVRRLIWMLGGATASRLGGTASGACRAAFGACPPDGHPAILFSKTGTSETGPGGEASAWIKDGGAGTPPAKVYMAVFRGTNGKLYAAGAMTLRIRAKPGSALPELRSNSAAELLFLVAEPLLAKNRSAEKP
jgi:hypothetical protein